MIGYIIEELRRVLIDRVVGELLGDLSARDVQMIIFGMVICLLVMQS